MVPTTQTHLFTTTPATHCHRIGGNISNNRNNTPVLTPNEQHPIENPATADIFHLLTGPKKANSIPNYF